MKHALHRELLEVMKINSEKAHFFARFPPPFEGYDTLPQYFLQSKLNLMQFYTDSWLKY